MAIRNKFRGSGRRHTTTWSRRCIRRVGEATKLVRALSELGTAISVLLGLVTVVGLELAALLSKVTQLIGR